MLVGALCAAAAPAARADVLVRFKPGTSAAERADARRDAGVRRERGFDVAGLEAVTTGAARDEAAAAALRREPDVLYAEPDRARRAALRPSDPLFTLQWGLARIGAPTAWNTTTGSPQVVVGVADTGVVAERSRPRAEPRRGLGLRRRRRRARGRGSERSWQPRRRDRRGPRG